MVTLYWVLSFFSDWAKLYMILFVGLRFARRQGKMVYIPLAAVSLLIAITSIFDNDIVVVPAMAGIGAIICAVLLLERLRFTIVVPLAYVVLSYVESMIASIIYWFNNTSARDFPDTTLLNITIHSISLLLIFSICFIVNFFRSGKSYGQVFSGGLQESALITLAILALLCFLYFLGPAQVNLLSVEGGHRQFQSLVSLMFGALTLFAVFCVAAGMNDKYARAKAENRAYEEMQKRQEDYFAEIMSKQETVDKLRHDLKQHLAQVQYFLENEQPAKALDYLGTIYEVVEWSKSTDTGNFVTNALVSDIFEDGFKLSWKGCFPSDTKMSNFHVCVLFANLLKNAHAAANQCDNPYVNVEIRKAKGTIIVIITNPIVGAVNLNDGMPKRKGGLGMRNIASVVDEYNGSVRYINEPGKLVAEVMFTNILNA